jgi:hypothetical protein
MLTPRALRTVIRVFVLLPAIAVLCYGQTPADKKQKTDKDKDSAPKITKVTVNENGENVTQLDIDLRNAPNSMEPFAEPRRIRIDDRANVRFRLNNLSPLDICSRNANAPTPTPETNVAESIVTTIAGKGAFAIGGSTANFLTNSVVSEELFVANTEGLKNLETAKPKQCSIETDPEYKRILAESKKFFPAACGLVGTNKPQTDCDKVDDSQLALATQMDNATRSLAIFAAQDFRGASQKDFAVESNPDLEDVRDAFTAPASTIQAAGELQAIVDEISTWASDLHKKYDYAPSPDGGSPATSMPPVVPGTLMVAPTELSVSPVTLNQVVRISSGGKAGSFTATSNVPWLLVSKTDAAGVKTLTDLAPDRGTFSLVISVRPDGLGDTVHYGAITISGTGAAKGTTIVNVTFKPPAGPEECALADLREIDKIVDRAKAEMSILGDNNKSLEASQASLKAAYMALVKVEDDYTRRLDQKLVRLEGGILVQDFNLGTDRKATSTGSLSCVSAVDGKTPTTTNISYSLLYQDVPHWTSSLGFLTSFQEKKIIGIANESDTSTTPPSNVQFFRVTDQARVQVIPMAFVNYRLGGYATTHYGSTKEDELIWTAHLSGGFGINPNSGTNQPEFFGGLAFGLNRFMFHTGVHVGRTQSLGGGYSLNTQVPSGLSTAPIAWSYHPAFTLGFSVRVAPF